MGHTSNGLECAFKAKFDGFCGFHKKVSGGEIKEKMISFLENRLVKEGDSDNKKLLKKLLGRAQFDTFLSFSVCDKKKISREGNDLQKAKSKKLDKVDRQILKLRYQIDLKQFYAACLISEEDALVAELKKKLRLRREAKEESGSESGSEEDEEQESGSESDEEEE